MSPIFGVLLVLPQITGAKKKKKKKKTKLTLLALLVQTSFVFTFVNLVGPTFSVPRVHVVNIELQEQ